MSYVMTEVYRGTNPGYGAGPLVIATYGANDDRYAYGTEHEVYEAPESLGTGHRGFKTEVIASITRVSLPTLRTLNPVALISWSDVRRVRPRSASRRSPEPLNFMMTR